MRLDIDIKEWKVEWRSGQDCVGIVIAKLPIDGKWHGYIGVAKGGLALNDAQYIRDWGAKLSYREAKAFFPDLKEKEYSGY